MTLSWSAWQPANWAGLVGAAGLGLSPLLCHLHILKPEFGLRLYLLFGVFAIFSALISLVQWFRLGTDAFSPGRAFALLGGIVFVATVLANRGSPLSSDVTTDPILLPHFSSETPHADAWRGLAAVSSQNGTPWHPESLRAVLLPVPEEDAFTWAIYVASLEPSWKITRVDRDTRSIEGFELTPVFGLTDTFVIEVDQYHRGEGGSLIHMRSKALEPIADGGRNLRRVQRFLHTVAQGSP